MIGSLIPWRLIAGWRVDAVNTVCVPQAPARRFGCPRVLRISVSAGQADFCSGCDSRQLRERAVDMRSFFVRLDDMPQIGDLTFSGGVPLLTLSNRAGRTHRHRARSGSRR